MEIEGSARQRALERALIKVRWFGVAFGVFQIFMDPAPVCSPSTKAVILQGDCEPTFVPVIGYSLVAGLALVNIIAALWLRRTQSERSLFTLGASVFFIDHLFLIGFAFLFSYGEFTNIWALLYILPLEGALRYGLRGALVSIGVVTVGEFARDFYRQTEWGFEIEFVPGTSFRVGVLVIIGLVAGIMARNLQRERLEVEKRAEELAEMAKREAALRGESQAFHRATLAGVSTGDVQEAITKMLATIGDTLGYPSLSIGILEDHPSGQKLRVLAGHNYPKEAIGKTVELTEGVCGPVAATGRPALVNDVSVHPGYLEFAPWARSEMAVPLSGAGKIIGVLNAESPEKDAFSQDDLDQLSRLATGVAVVLENARALEREQEAVKQLKALDAMKADFVAVTSHELRTPLTSIRGFVKTLRRSELKLSPEQVGEYMEVIDRQSERLARVIEDLLFVSQIDADDAELFRTEFNVGQMVADLIESQFSEQGLRIKVKSDGAVIQTDRTRLRRAVEALVDNALKYSPPSSPIKIDVRDVGSSIEVSVEDEGVGIPKEESKRIFDRFYQIGGSMRRSQQGFGLGLYITRQVIESLRGHIDLTSEPGKGAAFTIVIPKEVAVSKFAERAG